MPRYKWESTAPRYFGAHGASEIALRVMNDERLYTMLKRAEGGMTAPSFKHIVDQAILLYGGRFDRTAKILGEAKLREKAKGL